MRLQWTSPEDWVWVTNGASCTYVCKPINRLIVNIMGDAEHVQSWEISRILKNGQAVRTANFDTLEAAFARAQSWENLS